MNIEASHHAFWVSPTILRAGWVQPGSSSAPGDIAWATVNWGLSELVSFGRNACKFDSLGTLGLSLFICHLRASPRGLSMSPVHLVSLIR